MKKIFIVISIIIIGFCMLFLITSTDQGDPVLEQSTIVNIDKETSIPLNEQKDLARISPFYKKPESVPRRFYDFYDWTQYKRMNKVTEICEDKALDKEILAFFKAEIFNRANADIVRNNMANALCWQKTPDPELHKLFIQMLGDGGEDPDWRDYCIQFLSECFKSSNDKPLIVETFKKYSKGNDSKAGTALIHLAYQEGYGNIELDESYSEQIIAQLEDPKVHVDSKTAILGIIGKRNDKAQLAVIRKYAAQDEIASLKATAIGSLGLMGEEHDLKVIKLALYHPNGRVKMAAKAAKKRIEGRSKDIKTQYGEYVEAGKLWTKERENSKAIILGKAKEFAFDDALRFASDENLLKSNKYKISQIKKQRDIWYKNQSESLKSADKYFKLVAGSGKKFADNVFDVQVNGVGVKPGDKFIVSRILDDRILINFARNSTIRQVTELVVKGKREIMMSKFVSMPAFDELATLAWKENGGTEKELNEMRDHFNSYFEDKK